jgi:chromosome segregation ATPase
MRHLLTVSIAILYVSGSAVLRAQVPRSGGGESQQMMQQYQQLAAERTQLKAQVAQLQKDLDASKAELASMKKARDALNAQFTGTSAAVTKAKAAQSSAEQTLEQFKQRTNELVNRFRDMAQTLKQTEVERAGLQKELSARNSAFDTCAQNNVELSAISTEVLDRYEHVGMFTRISASEPFTKITRARIDNLVDDYRARAEELKVKKAAP